MFPRFAAACVVGSIAVAFGALVLLLIPGLTFEKVFPLTVIWCCVPLIWGLWAMIAPRSWTPRMLPLWGALLGAIAGLLAAFVLNLPSRVLGQVLSPSL